MWKLAEGRLVVMPEFTYPNARNAIFLAISHYFGHVEGDGADQEFASELTDAIMAALADADGVDIGGSTDG